MRPFLLLTSRPEDEAADDEYDAFLRYTGLGESELRRVRMEAVPLPALDLDHWSGVIVGGSPFTSSDPTESKSAVQLRVESELRGLLDEVVARDVPFFGACYGIGTLGVHQGGVVDRLYGENTGAVPITLTAAGLADPLLAGLPAVFDAIVGHKEACSSVPPGAVLLAGSPTCPVQMFRVRTNLYATQFHPELDGPGTVARIRHYQDAGYFPPHSYEDLIARLGAAVITEPPQILKNFVALYG